MSSFKKRTSVNQPKLPPGSRLSAHNGQLLTSTGVPSFDDVLGGGLPIGSVLMIKEDKHTDYAQVLLKYFLAQGIASKRAILLASADEDPKKFVDSLPDFGGDKTEEKEPKEKEASEGQDEKMTIAWRYQSLPKLNVSAAGLSSFKKSAMPSVGEAASVYCHSFDLTKRMSELSIESASKHLINMDDWEEEDDCTKLIEEIRAQIEREFSPSSTSPSGTRNILRIGVHSFASMFWKRRNEQDMFRFLHALRGLLRFSFGVCVLTVPAHLYGAESGFIRKLEHMCDAVVEIESFAGSEKLADFSSDYHGFFHVRKLPVLNTIVSSSVKLSVLQSSHSTTNNLAFKLRRKRFTIETFHLPIEGGVGERRTSSKPDEDQKKKEPSTFKKGPKVGCGSMAGKKDPLEF
ncbi:PAXNEB-domain-containing protein [Basidiobolus meristosporus CBS 931.73]|uniref:Elongator complex protein 4 n=1 Tax=Basidiobolus meristosporus CBS 931.73 TaxID=1314790 RepID=A0A1Y1ZC54_9FUNG|nr:PAXNEB-domain-containing protein [Basidiobolus meristosporus CBS 931.73]|eukprot:ORY07873.1 PAXNEB-domain-containing protein [Basidiobolus meristosporus CBS 931.73]